MNIEDMISDVNVYGLYESVKASKYPMAVDTNKCSNQITDMTMKLGNSDRGSGHDCFLKGIVVQFDLTMTPKMSVELERYHFIDFVSSCSTMHRITKFDLDKAYIEYVDERIVQIMKEKVVHYNMLAEKKKVIDVPEVLQKITEQMTKEYLEILYSNPCGFRLTARMTTNYQQLKTIYYQRKDHRLPEWRTFCKWVETLPNFKELCLSGEIE